MPRDRALERLRGFYDSWLGDEERLLSLQDTLLQTLRLHGYRRVDVPVVEQAELFLRKNGMEMATKLYAFTDLGRREVALRPEFTASLLRAAAEHHREGPWPLHLAYSGPVFRYEKPRRGTSRQFQQVGAELVGVSGVATDVEIIRLACAMTEACGVVNYRLVLGHLGMINALLEQLGIESHVRQFIVSHLEYYNRGPREQEEIHERLGLAGAADDLTPADQDPDGIGEAPMAVTSEAERLLTRVLAGLELNLSSSTRSPEEIVGRLLRKAQRQDQSERIRQALDFVARLGAIQGPPEQALAACADLLRDAELDEAPLDNLRAIVDGLAAAGFDWGRGAIHMGMARGIPYYTGMIFELYSADEPPLQLCGGGRYDDLARTLTTHLDVPALGFAFGVERLALAATAAGYQATTPLPPVVVTELPTAAPGLAYHAAAALRTAGIAAELDSEPRALRAALTRTRRLGYALTVVAGEGSGARARQHDRVSVYEVDGEKPAQEVSLAELPHLIRQLQSTEGGTGRV